MPKVPAPDRCALLGCQALRSQGAYCEKHAERPRQAPAPSDSRQAANNRYARADWQKMRAAQLSTQPLCQCCLLRGRVCQAHHVDHVFPWRVIGQDAFTRSPLQSLCQDCHRIKTWLERRGVFIHFTQDGRREYRAADYLSRRL